MYLPCSFNIIHYDVVNSLLVKQLNVQNLMSTLKRKKKPSFKVQTEAHNILFIFWPLTYKGLLIPFMMNEINLNSMINHYTYTAA